MPFTHRVSPGSPPTFVVAEGAIDLQACLDVADDLRSGPDCCPDPAVVVDLREMEYSPSMDDIRVLVAAFAKHKTSYNGRIGVLVALGPIYDLAELFCALARGRGLEMAAFLSSQAALDWVTG